MIEFLKNCKLPKTIMNIFPKLGGRLWCNGKVTQFMN